MFVVRQLGPFRGLVEKVSEVLDVIPFSVVREDDFAGLRIHTIDSTTVCCVTAQLQLAADDVQEGGDFTVNSSELITFLQNIDAAASVEVRAKGDADIIEIHARAQDRRGSKLFKIGRIHREPEALGLANLEALHHVNIRATAFTAFLSMCKRAKFKNVQFAIRVTPSRVAPAPAIDRYFTMSAAGDGGGGASDLHVYWGVSGDGGSSEGLDPPADFDGLVPADAEEVYAERFSREYLSKFSASRSSFDPQYTDISLCKKGQPMIMTVNLGVENSHVRFVLAAMDEDTDE